MSAAHTNTNTALVDTTSAQQLRLLLFLLRYLLMVGRHTHKAPATWTPEYEHVSFINIWHLDESLALFFLQSYSLMNA